ncbi:MAG: PTS sugar transporter subunit IIA [Alphaproteobacteria bacterium]|nr:PTS sugar transporter subunit IIA [Alphaproteobacteria bacterium]
MSIGIVLVTHGRLAEELLKTTEHVVGPQPCMNAVCIGPEDDMEQRRAEILAAARDCNHGDGVIVLTDMFGGTPSNLALSCMAKGQVEVIAGVNLPMLIKLASIRDKCPLDEAVKAAQDAGRKYIKRASELLEEKDKGKC